MLIEFRVANHRSIRHEQVFTMEAGRTSDADVRRVAGHKKPLLTVAAFYGANASGKSNLLSAIMYMQEVVTESQRFWDPTGGVPRDPFAWGGRRNEPSLYEVTFVQDAIKYQYGFVIDDERVLEEWLFAWPGSRKQTWFVRENKYKFGDRLEGENRVIEQVTRPNALFLSTAAQHGHKQLQGVYTWFAQIQATGKERGHQSIQPTSDIDFRTTHLNTIKEAIDTLSTSTREVLVRWMRVADVGITDMKFIVDSDQTNVRTEFLHSAETANAWLPLEKESSGTRKWFSIAPEVLSAIATGGVLIADELETRLHPLLVANILRAVTASTANPKGAQIIFSTHDTSLLGTSLGEKPTLSRDQVWLTEKDNTSGETIIYSLSDYKPRKAENVERGYLQGRYGAIPFPGAFETVVKP